MQSRHTRRVISSALLVLMLGATNGCMTAAQHAEQLPSAQDRKTTVGLVQKEIRKGMGQAEVAAVLGSPNIVSTDKDGIEAWIYDKIATEVAYSMSRAGVAGGGLLIGLSGGLLGGASASQASGASSQTQRTLTIIVKFKRGVAHDFTYHGSSF